MSTEFPLTEPEREPKPDPSSAESPKPASDYILTTTFVYDARSRLTEIQTPGQGGCDTVYRYDPPLPSPVQWQWEHLPDKRLYSLTAEGKTDYWRDNPTRYLIVEPDKETGMMKPALKRRRPVYIWLCREEREAK